MSPKRRSHLSHFQRARRKDGRRRQQLRRERRKKRAVAYYRFIKRRTNERTKGAKAVCLWPIPEDCAAAMRQTDNLANDTALHFFKYVAWEGGKHQLNRRPS